MTEMVEQHLDAIRSLCRTYGVRRPDLFGSAPTGAFDVETSDLDFVAIFADTQLPRYADHYVGFAEALEALFGRPVDVVTERSIQNPYYRHYRRAVETSRQSV